MDTRELTGIDRLAGIVTTGELLAAGVTRSRISTLVRIGELVSLGHGTYAMASLAEEVRKIQTGPEVLRAVTALATARAGTVASHGTAALVHGLDLVGSPPSSVTVTRAPGIGSRSGKPDVRVHWAALPAAHVTERLGLPVTTVARTVVDLARSSDFREGVVVADSALRSGQISGPALRAVLEACARWPGIHRAEEVVAFADRLSESALESIA
jgi:predicted transcriptional regulator of viral defense system